MKRSLLLVVSLLVLVPFTAAQRLPDLAVPENYKLTFAPGFEKDNFAGEETIQIRVLKPTSEIVLNAVGLDFEDARISSEGATQKAKVTPEKEKETVGLAVEKSLAPGPATIQIRYTGVLSDQLRGFYLGKEKGKKYAATQFEATDARRAFPSFDEPDYKASFDITVIADKGLVAISNQKVVSDTPDPGDGKHTVRFATTAKMSSYLVAVAVGDFEYIEGSADGIPIRVYATPGKKQLGTFALVAAEQCMKYFNGYFGIRYPFEKLDLIALPDFAAGAMENTGAITFREVALLMDDKQASVDQHKGVALVIAHEMAHQWFGDLVTMKWWDDVWLNEGFATWMESKPVAAWKPEWNLQLDDVLQTSGALNVDSLANTRPIHQAAETPEQIQELFDGIAYGKAAAVLRMLEAYLGPEVFRAGVNQYVKQHAYGNATADDFWSVLAAVSNKPVDRVMPTFVKQPGAPMVTVSTQCSGNSAVVTLSQQRYFYDRSRFKARGDELWLVPVCMKEAPETAGKGQEQCELLSKRQESFTLDACTPWVLANAGATGYYRSVYDTDVVRAMSRSLEKGFTPAERIRLLGDEWASVRVGRHQIGDYLALAEGLQADRNRAVIDELTGPLEYIGDHLVTESDREKYQQWVWRLLSPAAKELGWQPAPDESDERKSLRARVMHTLGYTAHDAAVLAQANQLTQEALANPSAVERTMAFTVFSLAAMDGDAALYDKILQRMKKAGSPEEYYLYLQALAQFSDPQLLQRTLDYALTPEVRSQDMIGVIAQVMENPAGQKLAWKFAKAHWPQIEKSFGGFGGGQVVAETGSFCDAGLRDEVKDFFASHRVPAAERTLKQSLERVNYCVDLKAQQTNQLAGWLEQHGKSAGK